MTIDEAISHAEEVAEGQDKCAEISVSEHTKERISKCAADHRQLAEWLRELKEAKELLKAAVEDFRITSKQFEDGAGHCLSNGTCAECKLNGGNLADECQWIHEAEALKLIGETNDEP